MWLPVHGNVHVNASIRDVGPVGSKRAARQHGCRRTQVAAKLHAILARPVTGFEGDFALADDVFREGGLAQG